MSKKMNVALLRRIKKEILAEPKRLHMGSWISTRSVQSPCGTTACIAGWACLLKEYGNKRVTKENLPIIADKVASSNLFLDDLAIDELGITEYQANRLFYVEKWPYDFRKGFVSSTISKKAKVTANRIEYFIKHKR